MDTDDDTFTEEAIQRAFAIFDLDKNGYIGCAELKHILIMMGEIVSDEEIDMMISMLDLNGDGQVSFKVRHALARSYQRLSSVQLNTHSLCTLSGQEFRAMAQSPDPANDDFLKDGLTTRSRESIVMQRRNEEAERKRSALVAIVKTCRLDKEDVYEMWKSVREKSRAGSLKDVSEQSIRINLEGVQKLLPAAYCSAAECRSIFDLLRNDDEQWIDSRDLIMTLTSFVADFGLEERCRLAFAMFDVDRSGYLSLDEIEVSFFVRMTPICLRTHSTYRMSR